MATPAIDPKYNFDSTQETSAQYLARTQGAAPGSSSNPPAADPFVTAIQNKLMGQSDLISSANTGIEDKINSAIGGLKNSATLSDQATTLDFNRQIQDATDNGATAITQGRERQGGFATNVTALRELVQTTDKNLNDLESRKQSAILQNDSATASKISDLQMQALQFQQQAQQQTFSNLLGMANFGLSAQQQQTQKEQFDKSFGLQQDQAMSQIALQYGLKINPGETLQSLYSRATKDMGANSPAALAIRTAQSQITANNASAAKALSDAAANKPLDDASLTALGNQYLTNPQAVLGAVKTTEQLGQILQYAGKAQSNNVGIAIKQDKSVGISKASAVTKITNNQNLSPTQQADAINQIESIYGSDSSQPLSDNTLPALAGSFTTANEKYKSDLMHFLTGN